MGERSVGTRADTNQTSSSTFADVTAKDGGCGRRAESPPQEAVSVDESRMGAVRLVT